jgi:hypothetical protein
MSGIMKHSFTIFFIIIIASWLFSIRLFATEMPGQSNNKTGMQKRIVFGGDENYPPFLFRDDEGNPSGYHIDLIIHEANNKEITGVYNAAAPYPVDQKEVIKVSAACLNKKAIPFPVPRFILKLLMGERAGLIMDSYHMSAEKIIQTGFAFEHPRIEGAIANLLK